MACCLEGDDMFAIVNPWRRVSGLSPHSSKWEKRGQEQAVWRAANLDERIAWQEDCNGVTTVIFM